MHFLQFGAQEPNLRCQTGGTDPQRVVPGSSDETRQQSAVDEDDVTTDEEEVSADITYPSSRCKPEIARTVYA
jgi:hypothetical protein